MYKDPNEKSLAEIMKKDDRYATDGTNSLSELGRKFLAYNRVTMPKLGKLVDAWTLTRFRPNDKLRSSAKSNALKAIADPEMTWNTFLRLCQILNFKRVNFTAQVITHDDQVQFYQTSIINPNVRPGEEGYLPQASIPSNDLLKYIDKVDRKDREIEILKQRLRENGLDDQVNVTEDCVGV